MIRHAVIRGRVQGVGYRAWVEDEAHSRDLAGWVRNCRDGTVEAVFSGPDDAVTAMLDACRRGPRAARVEAVEVAEGSDDLVASGPRGARFSVLPTV